MINCILVDITQSNRIVCITNRLLSRHTDLLSVKVMGTWFMILFYNLLSNVMEMEDEYELTICILLDEE